MSRTANKFQKHLVGTLFDEEQQDKKTNIHNMKAKDPNGNTRWKGAFTGGFEAGYKNTCGSKDGWAPSSFVSSVYQKADPTERNVLDYMDKEDLGREAVGQNIVLNSNFQTTRTEGYNITLQQSVGQRILAKLKRMEAHRTAPQSEEEMHKLFDLYAKDEEQPRPNYMIRDLLQPLSVGGTASNVEQDDFIEAYQDFYRKVIREHAKAETEEEIQKRREENRVYFDFTRPLEEEPAYLKEIQEIDESQGPRKRKKNLMNQLSLKHIYSPTIAFKELNPEFAIETAPEDYDPYSRMRGVKPLGTPKVQEPKGLNAQKRGQLLGQTKLSSKFVSSQNSLTNKFLSSDKKVQEITKFFEDEKKNVRFTEYVEEMEGKKISSQLEYFSYEQAEKERMEFEQKYKEQFGKDKDKAPLQKEQVPPKGKSSTFHISRRSQSWRPEKLLCKRFNILAPYNPHKAPIDYDQFL